MAAALAVAGCGLVVLHAAGELGAVRQIEIERTDAVPDHVAGHLLGGRGKGALRAVFAGLAPEGISGAAQEIRAVLRLRELHAGQQDVALGVGGEDQPAALALQCAAHHLIGAAAILCRAAAVLADQNRPGGRSAVGGHAPGQRGIENVQVAAAQHLRRAGGVGGYGGAVDSHTAGGDDGGRFRAVGGIKPAAGHQLAAAQTAHQRRGFGTVGLDGHVENIELSAAGHAQPRRGSLFGRDGGIRGVDLAAAVGEQARRAGGVGGDGALADVGLPFRRQQRRTHAVVPGRGQRRVAGGVAVCAADGDGIKAHLGPVVHDHRVFLRGGGFDGVAGELRIGAVFAGHQIPDALAGDHPGNAADHDFRQRAVGVQGKLQNIAHGNVGRRGGGAVLFKEHGLVVELQRGHGVAQGKGRHIRRDAFFAGILGLGLGVLPCWRRGRFRRRGALRGLLRLEMIGFVGDRRRHSRDALCGRGCRRRVSGGRRGGGG